MKKSFNGIIEIKYINVQNLQIGLVRSLKNINGLVNTDRLKKKLLVAGWHNIWF